MIVVSGVGSYILTAPHPIYCCTTTTSSGQQSVNTGPGLPITSTQTSSASSAVEQAAPVNLTERSPSGLELQVYLDSSVFASGTEVAAQVTLFNSLDENLSLAPSSPTNSSIQSWNGYDYFCDGYGRIPEVGYALFQGYYSQNNLSLAGTPVQLAPFVELPCATWAGPSSIVFLPHSDTAEVYGTGGDGVVEPMSFPATTESCSTNGGTTQCGVGTGLFGYWNTSAPLNFQQAAIGSPFFRYFAPGAYTLAAQDVWNQTVYAHFLVTQASAGTTTTSTTSGSYTSPPSGSSITTITVSAGQVPPCGCVLVDSNANGSLYASPSPEVGDVLSITASLNGSPQVYLSVTNASGSVVFSGLCVATPPPGAPTPTGDECTVYWNTANPDPQGNAIRPGTYLLAASDFEGSPPVLEANLALSSSSNGDNGTSAVTSTASSSPIGTSSLSLDFVAVVAVTGIVVSGAAMLRPRGPPRFASRRP